MSFHHDRYDRRPLAARRSTLGYWVPLVLTVTVATAGLAAWVWSERRDDDADDDDDDDDSLRYGDDKTRDDTTHNTRNDNTHNTHNTNADTNTHDALLSRVQTVIRRTPSPQQVFDTVSKKTAAGWAAAGAALASIREEDRHDAYPDHSRWSEEAATRTFPAPVNQTPSFTASARRKTVVLVVSAESLMDAPDDDATYRSENATILSHLPDSDFSKTNLFVLIYSPTLRSRPASRSTSRDRSPLGSSYSAISTPADPQIYTPALSARSSDTLLWNTLHTHALRLVERPTMALAFTTPSGFVHMTRHLSPDLVYVVDALSGPDGKHIADLARWVPQTVVVVGSDGTGLGRLVDTDDEAQSDKGKASEHRVTKWWETADMVGLGKGVEVVDASRFEDDYERRVAGRE